MGQNLKLWLGETKSDTFIPISQDPRHIFQNQFCIETVRSSWLSLVRIMHPITEKLLFSSYKEGPGIFSESVHGTKKSEKKKFCFCILYTPKKPTPRRSAIFHEINFSHYPNAYKMNIEN